MRPRILGSPAQMSLTESQTDLGRNPGVTFLAQMNDPNSSAWVRLKLGLSFRALKVTVSSSMGQNKLVGYAVVRIVRFI